MLDTFKRIHKVFLIIGLILFSVYAVSTNTMIKNLSWYVSYKENVTGGLLIFFQILAASALIYQFGKEWRETHYALIKEIPLFLFDHLLLIAVAVFYYWNITKMQNAGAMNNVMILSQMFYLFIAVSIYDFHEYLPWLLGTHIAMMGLTVVLFLLHILPDVTYVRSSSMMGHSCGYIWPLDFGAHLLMIVLLYIIYRHDSFTLWEFIIINIGNFFMMKVTTAKTDTIMIFAASLGAFLLSTEMGHRIIGKVLKLSYLEMICAPLVTLYFAVFYQPGQATWEKLNAVFNHRFQLQHQAISRYGLHVRGTYVKWRGFGSGKKPSLSKYNFVDNAYLKSMIDFGYGYTILFIAGCLYGVHYFFEEENYSGVLAFAILFLFGFLQHQLAYLTMNPLLFVISGAMLIRMSDVYSFIIYRKHGY